MGATAEPDITGLLRELSAGSPGALDRVIPVVYAELRRIAHGQLLGERAGHTLSTTALVHEAYLKLANLRELDWQHRAHFYAVAARLMRHILVDYARGRKRAKRGGASVLVPLGEAAGIEDPPATDLADVVELDEALTRLESLNARQCRVVECRCVAGLSVQETAVALGISPATVKRDWAFARAWLNRELGRASDADGGAR
jgi:RNA polymerase sigma factor (TIGR02999 family)